LDPYWNMSVEGGTSLFQNWTYISSERRMYQPHFKGSDLFYIKLSDIQNRMGTLQGVKVRGEAFITEFFYNNTQRGFCESKIINNSFSLKFVGNMPNVFKPGMPYHGIVVLRYHDLMAVPHEVLSESELSLHFQVKMQNGSTVDLPSINISKRVADPYAHLNISTTNSTVFLKKRFIDIESVDTEELKDFPFYEIFSREKSFEEFRQKGIFQFTVDIPEHSTIINISAVYSYEDGPEVSTTADAYAALDSEGQYISVHVGSQNVKIGHFVVFHVRSNFMLSYFDWVIVSKNIIVNFGHETVSDLGVRVTTFSLVVSSEMAPGFQIIVYTVSQQNFKFLIDSAYSPVQTVSKQNIEFKLSHRKDHTMETVEATCKGDPGAIFLSSSLRSYLFPGQGINHITKFSLLENLQTLEKTTGHIKKVFFSDRDGENTDKMEYYPSMNHGIDSMGSLNLHYLFVLSDFVDIPLTNEIKQCASYQGLYPCLIKGCYTKKQICDGHRDCVDGLDESSCDDEVTKLQESLLKYRLSRWDRNTEFYDIGDGDWGWFALNIDEDKEQFPNFAVPLITDSWFLHVMSISDKFGIRMYDQPISYDSIRPIHFVCEAPPEVRRGESIGVRCLILNRSPNNIEAVVILNNSPDYEFIHVEEDGYVVSYAPRTSKGDHHHLVFVRGEDELEVILPVKPIIEQGEISVSVTLSTQVMSSTQDITIVITPEGCGMHRHTSALIDLKNRAFEVEYLDIVVDETPLIPYEINRRYIYGSPYGIVSISGDVVGPTFLNDEPVSLESMFPEFAGKFGKGSEYHAFNLAANTWQLHYYRLTNQLQENWDLAKAVFEQMNLEYTAVMRRFSTQGWVSMWDRSGPSVWLTAWCIRIFQAASFQDWEDFFFVDSQVISSAVMWLINYQQIDGAFSETEYIPYAMHRGMDGNRTIGSRNISLTAHVLISLQETAVNLQGRVKRYSATSRQRATTYLERNLARITDPYDMALTAYALALSKSPESDSAYGKLLQMKSSTLWGY